MYRYFLKQNGENLPGNPYVRADKTVIIGIVPATVSFDTQRVFVIGDQEFVAPQPPPETMTFGAEDMVTLRDIETGEKTDQTIPVALALQAIFSIFIDGCEKTYGAPAIEPVVEGGE